MNMHASYSALNGNSWQLLGSEWQCISIHVNACHLRGDRLEAWERSKRCGHTLTPTAMLFRAVSPLCSSTSQPSAVIFISASCYFYLIQLLFLSQPAVIFISSRCYIHLIQVLYSSHPGVIFISSRCYIHLIQVLNSSHPGVIHDAIIIHLYSYHSIIGFVLLIQLRNAYCCY